MCAWKRGTQNNQPGTIRKGHIREFIAQSCRDNIITGKLIILEAEKYDRLYNNNISSLTALICSPSNGLPSTFLPYIINNSNSNDSYDNSVIYLHAHEYPRSIIKCIINSNVPKNSIIMNQALRVNSKVCVADNHNWSVYLGDITMYDCREGSIGDHRKRFSTKPPPILKNILIEIQVINRSDDNVTTASEVQGVTIANKFARALDQCVVTTDDVYLVEGNEYCNVLGRVIEVHPDSDDEEDSDGASNEIDSSNNTKKRSNKDALEQDHYRGVVDQYTTVYIQLSGPNNPSLPIVNIPIMPPLQALRDIVNVYTNDEEMFPVKRALLRPCIALTSVVQKGRGKYRDSEDTESASVEVSVDMDACTFDRVLLYLEHEARDEEFKFDPLLVNELRDAAIKLNISGLRDICDKVLGSFKERIRNTPIRFSEVLSRNGLGNSNDSSVASYDRKETWLVMSGMVLDITRWLPEHPGGSTIIPEQALGVDCTVFFEIYHASRQSFLYLKEFYIGELALEDRETVPLPKGYQSGHCDGKASDAFLEQLSKVTAPWRLDVNKMDAYRKAYKSF